MAMPLDEARAAAQKLVATLTLEEKVSLLTAADFWRTTAIPAKGIPAVKTTDGPNGARGSIFVGGTKAALFPCGASLAATWNKALVQDIGQALGREAKTKSADILLAPTVCLHRHPLGGRNFESFSEDPVLTGKLAAAYIRGVQGEGVAATIKHFVGNEQETERMRVDAQIPERALRELYLRPFAIAVREANPWVVMSSYNRINGVHADMNVHTLQTVLRGEWGYDGTVISDWTGTNSTVESIAAGCDVEFPHSTKWRLDKAVAAVREGRLEEAAVDRAAENVLTLVLRVKGQDLSPEQPEREEDRPKTRALIREAGVQGLTLLKNDGAVLPLDASTARVAVIGPHANRSVAGGGGSASLNPHYTTVPLTSIREAVATARGLSTPEAAKAVPYELGCETFKWVPLATALCRTADGSAPGLTLSWYAGSEFQGKPVAVEQRDTTGLLLFDSVPLAQTGPEWSVVATAQLTPPSTGRHTLAFQSMGPGRLYVDGKLAIDEWEWTTKAETMFAFAAEEQVRVDMEAGKPVTIRIETTNELRPRLADGTTSFGFGGLRLGFREADDTDHVAAAVAAAAAADVAVVVVGLDDEWESEGYDRKFLELPPQDRRQDRLIEAVVAANPRTVVVCQSGSPVAMPWADRVPTILQAWYQGQEAGNALADVLFGRSNPSGKLPVTFPHRLEDTPAFHTWPGEHLESRYGEGIFVGYRHFERVQTAPLFAFGHGLSYTHFAYGAASISAPVLAAEAGAVLTVVLSIRNAGAVAGAETVQAYVRDEAASVVRPSKELAAFEKVSLRAGEAQEVRLQLDRDAVGYYDTAQRCWVAEAGVFSVLIGASSADIRQTVTFEVKETFTWVF